MKRFEHEFRSVRAHNDVRLGKGTTCRHPIHWHFKLTYIINKAGEA